MTTQIEILESFATAATAREAAQLATLQNGLDTASTDSRPTFSEAAEKAARDLLETRVYQAGLAALINEMTIEGAA